MIQPSATRCRASTAGYCRTNIAPVTHGDDLPAIVANQCGVGKNATEPSVRGFSSGPRMTWAMVMGGSSTVAALGAGRTKRPSSGIDELSISKDGCAADDRSPHDARQSLPEIGTEAMAVVQVVAGEHGRLRKIDKNQVGIRAASMRPLFSKR